MRIRVRNGLVDPELDSGRSAFGCLQQFQQHSTFVCVTKEILCKSQPVREIDVKIAIHVGIGRRHQVGHCSGKRAKEREQDKGFFSPKPTIYRQTLRLWPDSNRRGTVKCQTCTVAQGLRSL